MNQNDSMNKFILILQANKKYTQNLNNKKTEMDDPNLRSQW